MPTGSTQDVSHRAGDLSRTGRDFVVEDAGLRRLRHHLLRLTRPASPIRRSTT